MSHNRHFIPFSLSEGNDDLPPFFTRTAPNTLPETGACCLLMKKLALSRYAVEVHLQHIAQKQETAATEVPTPLQPYTNLTQSTMKCALPAPSPYSANLLPHYP